MSSSSSSPSFLSSTQTKRIEKEKVRFQSSVIEGLTIAVCSPELWHVKIEGECLKRSIYVGESFSLSVRFTKDYPFDSPEVMFIGESPCHEHIYGNGHICLNILGSDWSPALTVSSIVLSVISMLSSATVKIRPQDNDRYVRSHPPGSSPKNTIFVYHDDKV